MGGKQTKVEQPPPPPPKTVKEMVRESTRSINRMRNEFKREIMKQEMQCKKLRADMEKMIKKKENKSHIAIIAKQLIKSQSYVTKYNRLDAQLNDVLFQLNTCATTDTMVKVMSGMNNVMKLSNEQMDVNNIQMIMEQFNMQVEKQEMMGEMISDIMDDNDEVDVDDEATKMIMEVEKQMGGQGGGQGIAVQQQQGQQSNEFEDRLQALKD